MDSRDDSIYGHDEADVTMIAFLLQAAEVGKDVVRILSDDTDVLVLLIYWVWKMQLHSCCKIQMESWNGVVININATYFQLGSNCLQLLGMHAISGRDTVSYPFNKGKISALNALKAGDFPGLFDVIGEEDATNVDLLDTGHQFFAAMYGQPRAT